jgi:hypothetical protein
MEPLAWVLFGWLYGISIYTDLKWHKIKNFVTFPVAGLALILMVFRYGLKASFFYVLAVIVSGGVTELFRIWGSGDTKLFIAGSLLSALLLRSANPYYVSVFLLVNIMLYLIIGHIYTFYKSGFKPALYVTMLRVGGEIGKIPGAIPIAISNLIAIILYFVWQ